MRFLAVLLALVALELGVGLVAGPKPPQIRLLDLSGVPRTPLAVGNLHAIVVIFIAHDCPVANQYAPEIGRIYHRFNARGIRFFTVYEDVGLTPKQARIHAAAYALPTVGLMDPNHLLAHKLAATVTPQAVVLDHTGRKVYLGRIDNLYASLGVQRPTATKHDLIEAILAALAGKRVINSKTQAVGCFIPTIS